MPCDRPVLNPDRIRYRGTDEDRLFAFEGICPPDYLLLAALVCVARSASMPTHGREREMSQNCLSRLAQELLNLWERWVAEWVKLSYGLEFKRTMALANNFLIIYAFQALVASRSSSQLAHEGRGTSKQNPGPWYRVECSHKPMLCICAGENSIWAPFCT